MSEKKIMLGNEAIARGAYEAGVKVSSAYPGTPSTEISENIVKYPEIYAEWAPNEKVAMEVAIGASISGVRDWYWSQPTTPVCIPHKTNRIRAVWRVSHRFPYWSRPTRRKPRISQSLHLNTVKNMTHLS